MTLSIQEAATRALPGTDLSGGVSMEERARSDLESIYGALGKELAAAGSLTIAVIVLFPHLRSVKSLGFPIAA